MINRDIFYNNLEKAFKKITDKQKEGFEAILDEYENRAINDLRKLSYILATIWHETARTMQPIEEIGKGKAKLYGRRLWYNRKPYFDVYHIYYGRGHVQLTWRDLYKKMTLYVNKEVHDWDFENNPNLMLQMQPSIWVAFLGMEKGLFTGRKLGHYFNDKVTDPLNARKIINGLDKSELIKTHYEKFFNCLK